MKKIISVLLILSLIIPFTVINKKEVLANSNYNYGEALQKALMFYEFQRSGELPDDKRDNWRGDSGLSDGADAGLDLTGGWYDAGDHAKFNLPMAYSATMLAFAVYEAEDALIESGQLEYILDSIKWVSDYLIKCHPEANVFYYQVGDGNLDHSWWGPAEVMQMKRPSFKVDLQKPGSSVAGEAAAALAATGLIFKDKDPSYAATCIRHAKELYAFADSTKSDAGYTAANGFYTSHSGFYDELSWAGVWLYLATDDSTYLDKAESYVSNWGTEPQSTTIGYKWAHCWDDVHYGSTILLAKITGKDIYKTAAEMHLDYWTTGYNGNRIAYTPKGLAWLDSWGALRYATTTAFLASVYADWSGCSASKAEIYNQFAKSQVDYALGSSGRSYVVGYGVNSPKHPHHRTAHSSWTDSLTQPTYHRHTVIGALVGGPGKDDGYTDDISNYINNEIATDYNAGFVGALAKLYDKYGGTPIANLNAIEEITNDEFFVEAGVNSAGTNFVEIKAYINNRTGWPARMGDKLSFKYYVNLTEAMNLGYTLKDFTITTNYNNGAKVSSLLPFDEANHIYYVNVDFTGTKIYPGGQSAYRKEVQFRIAGPQATSFWDNNNDFSYGDIKGLAQGTVVKTAYIPVYDNGVKVFGNEPGTATNSSSITPVTAVFDKLEANQSDIAITMNLNGNTLSGLKNGTTVLTLGTDYTVSGNVVTLLKSYLSNLSLGTANITFDFSAGLDPKLSITIKDTTPSASITPIASTFDKAVEQSTDINVTITKNGHTLQSIKNGSNTLVEATDYTVTNNIVTIKKEYLSKLSIGNEILTFEFSGGNNATLAVSIIDSSIVVSGNLKIQMFNGNQSPTTNGIAPRIKLFNDGDSSVNLADITLRYYYTIDGDKSQSFWCDWSTIGSSNVIGKFIKMDTPKAGADYYLEISFGTGAGSLQAGQGIEVQARFSKVDWTNYTQTGDYSFSETNTNYVDHNKMTGYVSGDLSFGIEP